MLSLLGNKNTLHHTTNLPLIITNNADHKICIPQGIAIGTPEGISEAQYNMYEITLDS